MTVDELKSLIRDWGEAIEQEWGDPTEAIVDEAIELVDKLASAVADQRVAMKLGNEANAQHVDEGPDAA
jgi:hypothetical protein